MKIVASVALAGSLFIAAAPMATVASAQDAAPKKAKKALDPNQRVCKSVPQPGSRMGESVCHTRAEWDQIDAANHSDAVDSVARQSQGH